MALVAFDFDGTLSDAEMTVLLGKRCGVEDEMLSITERAMNGELEYAESLRRRVSLLSNLSGKEAAAAFDEITFNKGAPELLDALQRAGIQTAILTGGFERGVRAALDREKVSVDVIAANRLGVTDGHLTGEVSGPLVEGTKDIVLTALASELDIPLADTVAIGDGANDLPMLRVAGLSIGFRPKPSVEPACDHIVQSMRELRSILYDYGHLPAPK